MPYFKTGTDEDILFIHIPKAGGSSIEKYFCQKYNVNINKMELHGYLDDKLKKKYRAFTSTSMQHLSYDLIYKMRRELNIPFGTKKIKVIASVRNPYDKVLSDMFFNRLLNPGTSPDAAFEAMKMYLAKDCYDNHNIPQHTFVTQNGKLVDGIIILKQEKLSEDMKKIGYTDFNQWENRTFNGIKCVYRDHLNKDSIELINKVFAKDFELFGYEML